jgi:hypothetical protein
LLRLSSAAKQREYCAPPAATRRLQYAMPAARRIAVQTTNRRGGAPGGLVYATRMAAAAAMSASGGLAGLPLQPAGEPAASGPLRALLRFAYRRCGERPPVAAVPLVLVYAASLVWRLDIRGGYVAFMNGHEMLGDWLRTLIGGLI